MKKLPEPNELRVNKEVSFEEGVSKILEDIPNHVKEHQYVLISVCGPQHAGKTRLITTLTERLGERIHILSQLDRASINGARKETIYIFADQTTPVRTVNTLINHAIGRPADISVSIYNPELGHSFDTDAQIIISNTNSKIKRNSKF